MIEQITEKLDAIESQTVAKVEEVKAEAIAAVESAKTEMTEKFVALEAKVSAIQAPEIARTPAKTIRQDVNRKVVEQLAKMVKKGSLNKEFEMFADESEYSAYLKEDGSQIGNPAGYGGGYNVGGRTAYDPVFHKLRLMNPLRGVSRNVTTDGSVYQFRAKTGNSGAQWGYAIQNNGAPTTENTSIWQVVMQDLNVQFPIRTAALDDIDGLESNVVDDMLLEFSQQEGLAMIQNNDQGSTSLPYGGSNGIRGLNQYGGANSSYTGGTISTAAFGSSGTASTNGLHSIATYDQITTNGDTAGANNVTFDDIINFLHFLPQEYWTPTAKIVVSPFFLAQIRGLKDTNGTPIFDRMTPLITEGIVGQIAGFDVVVNKYLDQPYQTTGNTATNLYPMYFGDFPRFHTIVDRLNMVLRRYDQTLPGFITFFGEKRLATSVVDPFSAIRYRSTATAGV
jgi:hypothetical protein